MCMKVLLTAALLASAVNIVLAAQLSEVETKVAARPRRYMRFGWAKRLAVLLSAAGSFAAAAPVGSPINPTTVPHAVPMTTAERDNVNLVLQWWREVIEGGHLELVPHFQAESYIQHNPNINTGRAGFLEAFGKDNTPVNPIPTRLKDPPPVAGARGEFVWVLWERRRQASATNPLYFQNRFELLRVRDAQVQEHWDADRKEPGTGTVHFGSSPKPLAEFDAGRLTAAEREARRVAIEAATQVYLHSRIDVADRLIAHDYIEHDPSLARETTWRARLQAFEPPKQLVRDEPVIAIVNGEYVLMMWDLSSPDPDDATRTYPWNYFQLVRVHGGKVVEHWDQDAWRDPRGAR
jgi:predicted SnoaL-like aldol condensation-catalyzing enzyme